MSLSREDIVARVQGLRRAREAIVAYLEAGNDLIAFKYEDCAGRRCAIGVLLHEAGVDIRENEHIIGRSIRSKDDRAKVRQEAELPQWVYDLDEWVQTLHMKFGLPVEELKRIQANNDQATQDPPAGMDIGTAPVDGEEVVSYINERIHQLEAKL